jgi:hypothetical protein
MPQDGPKLDLVRGCAPEELVCADPCGGLASRVPERAPNVIGAKRRVGSKRQQTKESLQRIDQVTLAATVRPVKDH